LTYLGHSGVNPARLINADWPKCRLADRSVAAETSDGHAGGHIEPLVYHVASAISQPFHQDRVVFNVLDHVHGDDGIEPPRRDLNRHTLHTTPQKIRTPAEGISSTQRQNSAPNRL
jgi:hypothetical protein